MIIAEKLYLELGSKILFNNISFHLDQQQRVAVLGRNGAGKTTLLRVIAGKQSLSSGTITVEKGKKIAYLPQEVVLLSEKTVLDEALSVHENLFKLDQEKKTLEKYFDACKDAVDTEKLDRYTELQELLSEYHLDSIVTDAAKILNGLGFTDQQCAKKVSQLSVGWKMRLVLAKLLLEKADFYLFDEPTNHLDLIAKDWFFDFLKQSSSGFLLVTHDQFFLENLCGHIFELERGQGKLYNGGYKKFLVQKERDLQALRTAKVAQEKEIKRKQETISRFRAKSSKARMAKSMQKELDKIEIIELPSSSKTLRIPSIKAERSGKTVLKATDLSHAFGDNKLFSHASFEIKRGDRAAIVAPNGKGKTTLISIIAGIYQRQSGEVTFGHNVNFAWFEQDQSRSLNHEKTILQEVEDSCDNTESLALVRSMLGAFLFSGDDVNKKIRVLSGGEKNRVAMVKVLLKKANFLILDEPTNHLDLPSKDILLQALKQYPGTILFVSHDRQFLNNLATCILELTTTGITSYEGNYDAFLYHKQQRREQESSSKKDPVSTEITKAKRPKGKQEYQRQKDLRKLENKVQKLENKRIELYASLEKLSYGTQEFLDVNQQIEELTQTLEATVQEWETLQMQADKQNS